MERGFFVEPMTVRRLREYLQELEEAGAGECHISMVVNPDGMTEVFAEMAAAQWLEDSEAPGGGIVTFYSPLTEFVEMHRE